MFCRKVEICGVNTAKLKSLNDEEKRALFVKIKQGDRQARNDMIDGNLRLVLSIVQRFSNRNDNPDDLFQVGCIGLMKAIDNFNTDLDVKFSTYAVPMIIGEVRRYLRDNNAIRVSRSVRDLAYKALRAKEILTAHLVGEPSIDEILTFLNGEGGNYAKEEVIEAMEAITEPISLYEPVFTDSTGDTLYLMDQLGDPESSDEAWLENIALKEAMRHLSQRERKILDLRYYRGKTQMEIAADMGISQAQVSRLEKGALEQIRKQM